MATAAYPHSCFAALYDEFLELVSRFDGAVIQGPSEVEKLFREIERFMDESDPDGSLLEITGEVFSGESWNSPRCISHGKIPPATRLAINSFLFRLAHPVSLAA